MPEKYTYLLIDLACLVFPFAFSFHPRLNFHKQWKYFFPACIAVALFFLVWDYFFVAGNVWSFNTRYITGFHLLNLPIEECLFFICVPYACVFTYHAVALSFNLSRYGNAANYLSWGLVAFLVVSGTLNISKLYTSVTFLLLAVFLILLRKRRGSFLPSFYLSFAIILLPFFISNGLLTGTGLAQPVVIYNGKFNMGLRMFTIPFEDTFYGMLLILMNVAGFEYLKERAVVAAGGV